MEEVINFNHHPYWSIYTKISWLQRYILIHSLLYYRYSESIVGDYKYDMVSKQLVQYQEQISIEDIRTKTTYGYVFDTFEGSTGFDLFDKLTSKDKSLITHIAAVCLDHYRESRGLKRNGKSKKSRK